jgi:hypothetical protein
MWKRVAGCAGGFGVVLTMLMLAQRLSGYENKNLAASLVRAATVLSVLLVLALIWDVIHWWRKGDHHQKPQAPERYPLIVPDQYGVSPDRLEREGLHVVNDGESAHEVGIQPIDLANGWILHFDETLNRIESKGKGFFQTVVSKNNDNESGLDGVWRRLKATADVPATLPFCIILGIETQMVDGIEAFANCIETLRKTIPALKLCSSGRN